MNKAGKVFYALTGLFVVISIIFLIMRDNFFDNMGILAYTNFLQIWMILGLLFLVLVSVISIYKINGLHRRNKKLEGEVTAIKVRLYDMEHKSEPSPQTPSTFNEIKRSDSKIIVKPEKPFEKPNNSDSEKLDF